MSQIAELSARQRELEDRLRELEDETSELRRRLEEPKPFRTGSGSWARCCPLPRN